MFSRRSTHKNTEPVICHTKKAGLEQTLLNSKAKESTFKLLNLSSLKNKSIESLLAKFKVNKSKVKKQKSSAVIGSKKLRSTAKKSSSKVLTLSESNFVEQPSTIVSLISLSSSGQESTTSHLGEKASILELICCEKNSLQHSHGSENKENCVEEDDENNLSTIIHESDSSGTDEDANRTFLVLNNSEDDDLPFGWSVDWTRNGRKYYIGTVHFLKDS